MKVRFFGPLDRVTGSCFLVKSEDLGVQFLVDCGVVQGEVEEQAWNDGNWFPDPAAIDFVLLTHAHVDHSGMLPRLVERGFEGKVYCTAATADLAQVILADAARLSRDKAFGEAVKRIEFVPIEEGGSSHRIEEANGLTVEAYRTSHILGAVAFRVCWQDAGRLKSIVFSGDIGSAAPGHEHLPLRSAWQSSPPSDYAVVESTYGDRARPPDLKNSEARLARLAEIVDRAVIERRGTLVIPCLAIDRTQTVLYDLAVLFSRHQQKYFNVPVYFDAPMASDVNKIYGRYLGSEINELMGYVDPKEARTSPGPSRRIHNILGSDNNPRHRAQRASLAGGSTRPAIIVTGGGMCDGGRVLSYLEHLLRDEQTTILFTGYVGASTRGHQIQTIGKTPLESRSALEDVVLDIELNGSSCRQVVIPANEVKAQIERMDGYSGHADRDELLAWCFPENETRTRAVGQRLFIVHGEGAARNSLRNAIVERSAELQRRHPAFPGVEVELPRDPGRWFDLNSGRWEDDALVRTASVQCESKPTVTSIWLEPPTCSTCDYCLEHGSTLSCRRYAPCLSRTASISVVASECCAEHPDWRDAEKREAGEVICATCPHFASGRRDESPREWREGYCRRHADRPSDCRMYLENRWPEAGVCCGEHPDFPRWIAGGWQRRREEIVADLRAAKTAHNGYRPGIQLIRESATDLRNLSL